MGFIGDIIGGVGQEEGASEAIDQERFSTEQALLRLDRARNDAYTDPYLTSASTRGTQANEQQAALLGVGGDPAAANAAFQNYLGSTGYQFRLGEGQKAVASSAAAKGLLNSGATAKGLTKYGQGLASDEFGNYFNQLGTLNQAGSAATANRLNASLGTASTGANLQAQSGANQAGYAWQGTTGKYNSYGNAANSLTSMI